MFPISTSIPGVWGLAPTYAINIMTLDVTMDDPRWEAMRLPALADAATQMTLTHMGLDPELCEVSLLACDDARIATLNTEFRDKPGATNVLSWPTTDLLPAKPGATPPLPTPDYSGEIGLGDIAIAYDTCVREATVAGKPVADHVTHLIVHGLLHLLGYDHIRDTDATLMEQVEVEILGRLGLDNPYMVTPGA